MLFLPAADQRRGTAWPPGRPAAASAAEAPLAFRPPKTQRPPQRGSRRRTNSLDGDAQEGHSRASCTGIGLPITTLAVCPLVCAHAGRQSVSRGGQGRTGTPRASHEPARVQWRRHDQDGRADATLLHQSTLSTHPPSSSAASSCCCCLVRPCQLGQTGTRARESRTGTETRSEAEDPDLTPCDTCLEGKKRLIGLSHPR